MKTVIKEIKVKKDPKPKEGGFRKISDILEGIDGFETVDILSGEALDRHLGNDNTVHVALLKGGLAKNFKTATGRLISFRGG